MMAPVILMIVAKEMVSARCYGDILVNVNLINIDSATQHLN